MKKIRGVKILLFVMIGFLYIAGFLGSVLQGNAKEKSSNETEQQFEIKVTSGFNNVARVGKNMVVKVTLTNQGEDFAGLLQILLPPSESNSVMYRNDISIAAGETKTFSVPVHIHAYVGKIIVNIADEKENVIAKKRAKITMLTADEDTKMIGVLTDKKDLLGYWENEESNVYYLTEKDIPEKLEGLDVLDMLIINDFDTKKLSDQQYNTLKQWVLQGGVLVIGTGENANQTLGIFQDDFLTGSMKKVGKDGAAEFAVDQGEVFFNEEQDITLYRVKKERGMIFVFSTDIGIDYAKWDDKGYDCRRLVYDHIPEGTFFDDREGVYYGIFDELNLMDKKESPNVKVYAIVLVIYILLVFWVLYFVLQKKDKPDWTWVCVPALALVFAGIIYTMGNATRVTEPFINYMRTIEWNGSKNGTGAEDTRIVLTSPYNEKYSLAVPKGETVYAGEAEYVDMYNETETSSDSYNIGFSQKKDQQFITLNNLDAFEQTELKSDAVVSMKGSYEANVNCSQYEFKGTFTNKTGTEIRNAVFLADGRMYLLGDIKNGEKVDISDRCKSIVDFTYNNYRRGYTVLGTLFEKPYEKLSFEQKRYMLALQNYFMSHSLQGIMEGKVIGYVCEEGADEDMSLRWGLDCSGITLEVFPVNVNYTNDAGEEFVSDLTFYGSPGESMDEIYRIALSYDKEVTVEYALKQNEKLTGLYYLASTNTQLPHDSKKGEVAYGEVTECEFEGRIFAYNFDTKKFEKIFDGDTAGECKDVERFVGQDKKVLLKIKLDNKSDDEQVFVPVISATKKVE